MQRIRALLIDEEDNLWILTRRKTYDSLIVIKHNKRRFE